MGLVLGIDFAFGQVGLVEQLDWLVWKVRVL